MKLECPICGSEILHTRIDDGIIMNRITHNGEIIEIENDSNGCDIVECSVDSSHIIPIELQDKILDIVQ